MGAAGEGAWLRRRPRPERRAGVRGTAARGCGCAAPPRAEQVWERAIQHRPRLPPDDYPRPQKPEVSFGLSRSNPWERGLCVPGPPVPGAQSGSLGTVPPGDRALERMRGWGLQEQRKGASAPRPTRRPAARLPARRQREVRLPRPGTCGRGGHQWALSARKGADKVCLTGSSWFSRPCSPAGAAFPRPPAAAARPWSPPSRSSARSRAPAAHRTPACSPTPAAGSRAGPSRRATAAWAPRTRCWSPLTSRRPSRSSSRRSTLWCSSWAWWATPWSCS